MNGLMFCERFPTSAGSIVKYVPQECFAIAPKASEINEFQRSAKSKRAFLLVQIAVTCTQDSVQGQQGDIWTEDSLWYDKLGFKGHVYLASSVVHVVKMTAGW